jgi:aspartate aminotransferase
MSVFSELELLPPDPILSIPPIFAADARKSKINLGVGAYRDASGRPWVLSSVRKAEKVLSEKQLDKEYLPIDGDKNYRLRSFELIFGEGSPHLERAYIAQTVGGTGALSVGGTFLKRAMPESGLYLSRPTWGNHRGIFSRCGYKIGGYDYYHDYRFDFERMMDSLKDIEPESVIVLHGCCHNPTGCDPEPEQWKEMSAMIKDKKIFPFFDLAYQGFGDDLESDALAIRIFANDGHEMAVAASHSKNFGLYGERAGHLTILAASPGELPGIASHVKAVIRSLYSSPPAHGARIVAAILESKELAAEWKEELAGMQNRIFDMRGALAGELSALGSPVDFSFIKNQKGLFTLLGISQQQVQSLKDEQGLYMLPSGRINLAGLNEGNIKTAAKAIRSIL